MTATLLAPMDLWQAIREDVLATPDLERAGVGFAGIANHGGTSLLLRDWMPVPPNEYLVQLGYHLEISPVFWARAAKRARQSGEALVLVHSHPHDAVPSFSASDDAGEAMLVPKLSERAPVPIAAIVVSPVAHRARLSDASGASERLFLRIVDDRARQDLRDGTGDRFDRQARALTREGQAAVNALRVAVVGAGGLGSHVIQQLSHLGVGQVVAVDPDRVEISNLSRLVGATRRDAILRRAKTKVARRVARKLHGPTKIIEVRESVLSESGARHLLEADVVIGCTDTAVSRTVLNAVAFQYYVPVMDLGVELQAGGARGGRVSWLAPGRPCLWCLGVLDPQRVRVEQLPEAVREAELERGYIVGIDEPAPAVVSINGVIASLGVTELLARVTGFAGHDARPSLLLYRVGDGVVRRTSPPTRPDCPTCSVSGTLGAGDLAQAPWVTMGPAPT
jgi:molybdopterin/thiamine biosynthesis adenylyltransferase